MHVVPLVRELRAQHGTTGGQDGQGKVRSVVATPCRLSGECTTLYSLSHALLLVAHFTPCRTLPHTLHSPTGRTLTANDQRHISQYATVRRNAAQCGTVRCKTANKQNSDAQQSAECRVQSAECRVQSAECRVQSAECRVQSAELLQRSCAVFFQIHTSTPTTTPGDGQRRTPTASAVSRRPSARQPVPEQCRK